MKAGKGTGLPRLSKRRLVRMRDALLSFYDARGRDFPWRKTQNWFHLLMAEMMLRRTRAEQVLPVYREFTAHYRTAQDALDDGDRVSEILQPLGLTWRNQSILKTLAYLRDNLSVRRLSADISLREIPGVGEYSNAMMRSMLFHERIPAIDTNVSRVICRYDGIPEKGEMRRSPLVKTRADIVAATARASEVNLAMIDFGALQCKARNPDCATCPLRRSCRYS